MVNYHDMKNAWFDTDHPVRLDFPWLTINNGSRTYVPAIERLRHRVSQSSSGLPERPGPQHSHRVYHFISCIEGSNAFRVNGKDRPFAGGDFFLINPGVPHNLNPRSSDYVRFYALTFRYTSPAGDELDWPWERVLSYLFGVKSPLSGSIEGIIPEDRPDNRTGGAVGEMETFLKELLVPGNLDLARLSFSFMDFIRRYYLMPLRLADGDTQLAINLDPLERSAAFIRDNYGKPLRLDDMAGTAHLSKSYFIEAFAGRFGPTPMEYLNTIRLDRAAYLLTHTRYSVKEIAGRCGYSSDNYFCKAFRRSRGLSPGRFREKIRD